MPAEKSWPLSLVNFGCSFREIREERSVYTACHTYSNIGFSWMLWSEGCNFAQMLYIAMLISVVHLEESSDQEHWRMIYLSPKPVFAWFLVIYAWI